MVMTDEDMEMLDGSIRIMRHMYRHLRSLKVDDAKKNISDLDEKIRSLYSRKDGKDTVFFDVEAEESISLGIDFCGHYSLFQKIYHDSGVVVTEERGRVPHGMRIEHSTPVIISDPVDRSSYLERIIDEHSGCDTMGDVFDAEREKIGDGHCRLESCNSSVTLLKDNTIKYSVILNLFTGEVFVAYEKGVFSGNIISARSVDDINTELDFKTDETLAMLCYTKKGKYENNRLGTHLRFFDLDRSIPSPGGPNRFTYLLEEAEYEPLSSIGVIAHNGEKIQESLPNIAVAYFSENKLQAFKLFCDREYNEQRAGKILTPNLQNSLYNQGLISNVGIKLEFLNNHHYPSQFRDTTVILPEENDQAMTMMEGMVKKDYAIRIV